MTAIQWRSTVCDKPAPAGSPRRSASGLLGGGRGQRRETRPGKPAAATTGGADESATAQRHVGQPVRTPVT